MHNTVMGFPNIFAYMQEISIDITLQFSHNNQQVGILLGGKMSVSKLLQQISSLINVA